MGEVADIGDVFDVCLNKMKEMAGEPNYLACGSIANGLTNISVWFDSKPAMLVSEVLEDVFNLMDYVLRTRVVDDDYQNKMREQLGHSVDDILKSFHSDDKNDLFNALASARSAATKFYYSSLNFPPNEAKTPGRRD